MRTPRILRILATVAVLVGLGATAFLTRDRWMAWIASRTKPAKAAEDAPAPIREATVLKLSSQARRNLGLVAKAAKPQTYWRTIQVPGSVIDRPGHSDRGVTSPVVGAVVQIHAFPGDTVRSGDRLFTLRLFSEYLQNTQSELFKATREALLLKEQRVRLEGPVKTGAIPEVRLIEVDNQLRRQAAATQAYRQDLLTRGLKPEQIDEVTEGKFVSTIEVVAPPEGDFRFSIDDFRLEGKDGGPSAVPIENQKSKIDNSLVVPIENRKSKIENSVAYEVQELKVDIGQQVQAPRFQIPVSESRRA